ncbi:UNKNOWN [Stylonychia lemnae]|uniref:Uncharacterized protein n=1 Tax=Stylonychia lemnae TaxID=5949 RepID=A0A078AE53_STYLE|nr:UNKNOWN [Stylonychia lemnae]|eukprot:CDW79792.1 UNKNOWN [Stylonychia lemnae]
MRSIHAKTLLGFTIAATCTLAYNPFVVLNNNFRVQESNLIEMTGLRQKVITLTYVLGLELSAVIQFSDFALQKQYTKISKIEKSLCDTTDLPADFNLTDFSYKFKNQSSGLTQYLGEKTLRWTGEDMLYAFHLSCKELKWVSFDSPLIINTPEGHSYKDFTDADFDGVTCKNHKKNNFNLFSYFNLKMII